MENYEFCHDEWLKIASVGGSTEDFRSMYETVDAVTDLPSAFLWEEILKAFPDSKIILTIRDNEDVWWNSALKQAKQLDNPVYSFTRMFSPTARRIFSYGETVAMLGFGVKNDGSIFFGRRNLNELISKMAYRRHNAYVLQNAPKDKLLIFNVKEGWEPLCKFLGLKIPQGIFPWKNANSGVVDKMKQEGQGTVLKIEREIKISLSCIALAISVLLYAFYVW
uniref:Uncharacterized LOC100185828 n=1 Tax=Ciona intestinalis TaxID=7719 RepID=F7ARK5_CIOIN|nr:uncharacterized protein LOC100185828 [Ciona intestinalis]|eukprot:XP_002125112.2 uncharacterized protein LOC100185828 [Ciona intestinalis]